MTREQLVAQALVSWLGQTLSRAADVARKAFPMMDVEHFFRELAALRDFRSEMFSIALVVRLISNLT